MWSRYKNKVILVTGMIFLSGATYLGIRFILPYMLPFLIAYLIAMFVNPISEFIHQRLRINMNIATIIVMIMILAILIILGGIVVDQAVTQLKNLVSNWSQYEESAMSELSDICCRLEDSFGIESGTVISFIRGNVDVLVNEKKDRIMTKVLGTSIPMLVGVIDAFILIAVIIVAVFIFAKDMESIKAWRKSSIFANEIEFVYERIKNVCSAYVKAQLIIMCITCVICSVGLAIMGNPYFIIIGIAVGFLDALPLFGVGAVMVPWTLLCLIQGDIMNAVITFVIFVICYMVREYLEPRLIGDKSGMKPIASLISVYIGYKLFGLLGAIIGPIAYILISETIRALWKNINADS